MRRSSFVQLTLLPMLASARLVHADPDPTPPTTIDPSQDPQAQVYDGEGGAAPGQTQPIYEETYNGPNGPVHIIVLPPGLTPVDNGVPEEVPCDVDPDQPRCVPLGPDYYYYGGGGSIYRGGFGSYFHGGGGGHGGAGG